MCDECKECKDFVPTLERPFPAPHIIITPKGTHNSEIFDMWPAYLLLIVFFGVFSWGASL